MFSNESGYVPGNALVIWTTNSTPCHRFIPSTGSVHTSATKFRIREFRSPKVALRLPRGR